MEAYRLYIFVFIGILAICFTIISVIVNRKNSTKTQELIPRLLLDNSIVYFPHGNTIYLNDKRIKKPHGKIFFKELGSLGTIPFITIRQQAKISARPIWEGKTSFIGTLYYYTPKIETLDTDTCLGKEYVLLFADIKDNPPSDDCICKIIVDDDKFRAAMLLVPLDEYKEKYYEEAFR